VSGVLSARETGNGRDLDVSLFDAALQNLCYLSTWYLNAGHVQGREKRSAHPSLVPSQLYRTADGFIFLMCNKEKFWPILCERLGRPEWADDPRFRRFKDRLANRDLVNRLLDEALSSSTTAEWLAHFAGQVPAAPVNDLQQALDNPFVAERGRLAAYGGVRMVAGPIVDAAAEAPRNAAPPLGADTDAVLREHGFSEAEIAGMRADRVI
jgi:succinate--hydroxymethylglutarate CoA-transferase